MKQTPIQTICKKILAGQCPRIDFFDTYAMRHELDLMGHFERVLKGGYMSKGTFAQWIEPVTMVTPSRALDGLSYIANHGNGCLTKNTFIAEQVSLNMEDLQTT